MDQSDQCAALLSQNEQLKEQLRVVTGELDELRSAETIRQVKSSDVTIATRQQREEIESLRTAHSIMQESMDELRLLSEARYAEAQQLAKSNAKLQIELEALRSGKGNRPNSTINEPEVCSQASDEVEVASINSPMSIKRLNDDPLDEKIKADKSREEIEQFRHQLENERRLTEQLRKLCMSLLPNLNADSQLASLLTDANVASRIDAKKSPLFSFSALKAQSVDRDGLTSVPQPNAVVARAMNFEHGALSPQTMRRRGSWPSGQLEDLRRFALASSRAAQQQGDVKTGVLAAIRKPPQFDTISLQGDLGSNSAPQPSKVSLAIRSVGSYSSTSSLGDREKLPDTAEKKPDANVNGEIDKLQLSSSTKVRQITEREYENLQLETRRARTREAMQAHIIESKLANYEAQVQSLQSKVKALTAKLSDTESECEAERKQRNELENQVRVLNEQLTTLNDTAARSLQALTDRAEEQERLLRELDETHKQTKSELRNEFAQLRFDRERVSRELERLRRENDSLVAKHSQFTVEMQAERINLPTTVDDCHVMLLRFIDELIVLKTTKQHQEENLRTENLILQERLDTLEKIAAASSREKESEQNERQELTAFIESLKMELERESKLRRETEQRFKEGETSSRDANAKLRSARQMCDQLRHDREKLAEDLSRARQRVVQLQQELTTSESVQRDFVRLSQSLQIELEKLRQVDTDVRWQHDEDAHDCSACHSPFSGPAHKTKQHCRHCGKVFCNDCLSKTVPSGPNRRLARVCDVCHTLLCKDAQPYFSRTPPTGVH